ncbi:MAG: hypothetical protein MR517_03115 [Bacteroidales bacterium]|nr:hypothetical protein [Bacteroidales bacterium]
MLDFILRFDFVFFLLGFAFLLRTSAIQVNLMALGLSSVAWHRLSKLSLLMLRSSVLAMAMIEQIGFAFFCRDSA